MIHLLTVIDFLTFGDVERWYHIQPKQTQRRFILSCVLGFVIMTILEFLSPMRYSRFEWTHTLYTSTITFLVLSRFKRYNPVQNMTYRLALFCLVWYSAAAFFQWWFIGFYVPFAR